MLRRTMCKSFIFLLLMLLILGIRVVSSFTTSILCARIPGLSHVQRALCTESPDAVVALAMGHVAGAEECQHQFRGHRWNCTQVWKKEVFGHIIVVGSKEAAFTYAIASAGAVHSIVAACARGNISLCGCDRAPLSQHDQDWKWGGCSADIGFGMKFARKFLDAREIEGDARSLMNLHNNRVGRKLVKNLLRTECKCHGVSGSCVMRTCWKSLPTMRAIGDVLMKKHTRARPVMGIHDEGKLVLINRKRGRMVVNPAKAQRPKRLELVYLQPSPNYCERDVNLGSLGTMGRRCNRTARGIEGCDLLCCGRGYNTHQINRTWQCRCKFQWCCHVQCDICHEHFEEYTCK
ncbi:protein Wnt-2 isoform X1 [Phlebotomus argentipes]|uniref:protein Wnt-2 isoform X1 n=1 Tax=Phlebotomus argentipes TaxID=94469 RepID=UPI0028932660|nr:protein Wnt-2 isoform X1 [Phlebotomus argentipes]XP_059611040.1 protein Wnt-2 isoform X1 [Phlebotomus argentipes]XP_059611041.1 protein Wnt-2 isoform X1 [Phlebotomus argentipes]